MEPALTTNVRAQCQLVYPNRPQGDSPRKIPHVHWQLLRNSPNKVSNASRAAGLLVGPVTWTTISAFGSSCLLRRKVSLMTRFTRLRSTARRKARLPTISPIRAVCIPFAVAIMRNEPRRRLNVADSKTRENSLESLSRKVLGKPAVVGFNDMDQAVRRLRHLARRALITLRPPSVAIRARNP
jgi:hypothetical protein